MKKMHYLQICKNTPNYLFTLKSPLFDSEKELSNLLKCTTYAMAYSEYYHGNITGYKSLPEALWALRVTS